MMDEGTDDDDRYGFAMIEQDLDLDGILEVDEDPETPNQTPKLTVSVDFASVPQVPISSNNNVPLSTSYTTVPINEPPPYQPRNSLYGNHDDTSYVDDANTTDSGLDIEALAAKACALASVPVPDYADAFERKNKKYKTKKYRDKVLERSRKDEDPNSVVLASKTSNILSNFQEYINEIETQSSMMDILSPTNRMNEVELGNGGKRKEGDNSPQRGSIAREWAYDDEDVGTYDERHGPAKRRGSSDRNLYNANGGGHHDDMAGDDSDHGSAHSSSKERQRYYWNRYQPILHSKKVKIGLVWIVVLIFFIGAVIIGISGSGGEQLDAKEAMLERPEGIDQQKQQNKGHDKVQGAKNGDKNKIGDDPMVIGLPTGPNKPSAAELIIEFLDVKDKYDPKWFARATGWNGTSWPESIDFCASQKLTLCPYEAYCAEDDLTTLYEEKDIVFNNGSKEQWSPVANGVNNWVQVGPYDKCTLYKDMYTEPPEWGMGGMGSQFITQNVLCCKSNQNHYDSDDQEEDDSPSVSTTTSSQTQSSAPEITKEDELKYEAILAKYKPREVDREEGWGGKTYPDAHKFCGEIPIDGGYYNICPYEAICPLGPDTLPMGGYRGEGGDNKVSSWMPISDSENDWVQISKENACIRYSSENDHNPDWGIVGYEDADTVSHIMCCVVSMENTTDGTDATDDAGTATAEAQAEMAELFENDAKTYQPMIYDRENGWHGQTFLEALDFCASIEGYHICPYDAVCPLGPEKEPLGGYKDAENGSWVPISDEGNGWVSLGSDNACIRYSAGIALTGVGDEDMTRNVMCCKGSVMGGAEESYMYEVVSKTYNPLWFDRKDGWAGQSYNEAIKFCQVQKKSLCPYDAICPMADLNTPSGGVILDEPNGSWAPIGDMLNEWVSVTKEKTCQPYGVVYGERPEWSVTGFDNEGITRHIACCNTGDDGEVDESQPAGTSTTPPPSFAPSKEATPPPTPLPSNETTKKPISMSSTATEEATEDDYSSVLKYNPTWYSRSSGWTGQTYDDAFSFCSRQGPDYDLCGYDVYCPFGSKTEPYGGTLDEPNGSWSPISDSFNEWVRVSSDGPCVRYTTTHSSHPSWGLTGKDNEDVTRYVMCCQTDNFAGSTSTVAKGIITGNLDEDEIKEIYAPTWYHRDEFSTFGWVGKSYADAISFCAQQDSTIPCPYEAYCPGGPGSDPIDGAREARGEAWAPIMDIPNGWVNVGSTSDSCELYNSIHPHPPLWGLTGRRSEEESDSDEDVKDITANIMCCREPDGDKLTSLQTTVSAPVRIAESKYEQDILDKKHPVWFSRKHGYRGTTHANAVDFCKSIADMVVCPQDTYCPQDSDSALFLQRDAFEGEQWAPVATSDTRSSHRWIQVGKLGGVSQSTCSSFGDVKGMKPAGWDVDDADPELKENVLCCLNPNHLLKEMNFVKDLDRVWLDESFGWTGGSHDDAAQLCKKLGNKKMCPYAAYCPHGPGMPVIGGHVEDFNMQGEHWAPAFHQSAPNYWVMIGRKYQNSATTCMDNWELEGKEPSWGRSDERTDLKKYLMCCSY